MTYSFDDEGNKVIYNYDKNIWEYSNDSDKIMINGRMKKLCKYCNMPSIDINNVKDCDFCLQGLSVCDFIAYACCGHGNPDDAYITFKDGRRWVLDKTWNRKINKNDMGYEESIEEIVDCAGNIIGEITSKRIIK